MEQNRDSFTEDKKWLSSEELTRYLGVSRSTVFRWLERSQVPAYKVGKQWRFLRPEIDDWVKSGGASDEEVNQ